MSTVTVVPTVEADNNPPRVRLDVTDTGSPPNLTANVTRLDPDGRTVFVRTPDGNPLDLAASGSDRVGLLYDYEMPYGAAVTYSTLESPATVAAPVTVDEDLVWLIHPGIPALSMPISIASIGSRVRPVARAVFRPMGRRTPVVQTDGQRKSPEGALELNTFTLAEAADFEALTDDAADLLLNVPAGLDWGLPTSYVSLGDLEEARLVDYAGEPRRLQILPYVVVDRPVGGSQAERTLIDLLEYPTLASLMLQYDTLADVLAGP